MKLNLNHRIKLVPSLLCSGSGELYIRYTPTLELTVLGRGTITFATWDCAVGAGQAEHEKMQRAARESAIKALHAIAADFVL